MFKNNLKHANKTVLNIYQIQISNALRIQITYIKSLKQIQAVSVLTIQTIKIRANRATIVPNNNNKFQSNLFDH